MTIPRLKPSPIGTIRHVNQAAAALFSGVEKVMIGRSLTLFMPDGERRAFRQQLAEMAYSRQTEIWEATMQSWHGISFRATLTTTTSYGSLGHPSMIRWIIQNMAAHAALAQPVERVRTVGDGSSG